VNITEPQTSGGNSGAGLRTSVKADALLRVFGKYGIHVHVDKTEAAAKLYNRQAENEMVGGLFHSTC
jgi:hypothetical protein